MEKYLVNFYHTNDDGDENKVCSFYCKSYAEFIKFLQVCKEYEVDFYIRQDDEKILDKYKDDMGFSKVVESFNVNYGSDDCIQTIDVWLS